MAVYNSSIKHHKLKRRVELKERKILEILKNLLGQFYILNTDLHTGYGGLKNTFKFTYNFIYMDTTFLLCREI